MSHDEFTHTDAAYVLGALSPAERRAYEEHLGSCAACACAVRELAGLPGLLAQVDRAVLATTTDVPAVPDTLLPGLVREARRARRRRLAWTLGGSAAAVLIAVTGVTVWSQGGPESPGPEETVEVAPSREMRQVGQSTLAASVAMEQVAWGTRLELTCTYVGSGGAYDAAPAPAYALAVRTRDGEWQQVATWRAVPGRSVTVSAATAAERAQIASVEVRTTSGRPVLELVS